MQRLLSLKLASNLPKTLSTPTSTTTSSSLFHFQPHRTFSLTKTQTQNHFFSSFPTNPLPHQHKVHGFLSNPLLRKHSSLDCRRGFLQTQFPKQKFQFIPSSNSQESVRRSSWFQRVSSNDMVMALILANVSVFCLWRIADTIFMYKNFTVSVFQFKLGRIHTLVTSAFSHFQVGHIVSNMLGLYLFGINIGRVFGPGFLLKLYLAGGIGGSVIYLTSLHNFMGGSVHTMITPAFFHVNVGHMVFNMIGLCYFGSNIGRVFGPELLLKLYVAGAIGGSIFHLVYHAFMHLTLPLERRKVDVRTKYGYRKSDISDKPGLGASGAVNAIMLLDILLHPAVPAVLLGIFLIGKDILRIMEGNVHP